MPSKKEDAGTDINPAIFKSDTVLFKGIIELSKDSVLIIPSKHIALEIV